MKIKNKLSFLFLLCAIITCEASEKNEEFSRFLPKGFVIFDTIYGDLNKDNISDCVLIIKNTDPSYFVGNEYIGDSLIDRNRRGIIVLFRKGTHYELIAQNDTCFSSENEDGGVYFPPELFIEIKNSKLYISYSHGRYGYWEYTFRYQHSDFALIGYDHLYCRGSLIESKISINYLTKKKQEKNNINENAKTDGDEIFKEEWSSIKRNKLRQLTKIENFDLLECWND